MTNRNSSIFQINHSILIAGTRNLFNSRPVEFNEKNFELIWRILNFNFMDLEKNPGNWRTRRMNTTDYGGTSSYSDHRSPRAGLYTHG